MHEIERHRIILGEVAEKPVATVSELVELTGASEATIRRDIGALHVAGQLRRVRGGAEALHPPEVRGIAGRPFSVNEGVNIEQKRAIARAAVALCEDGDSIIINGGTTTFQMVHHLARRRMQILTNSFPIAEHLLRNSKKLLMLPLATLTTLLQKVVRDLCRDQGKEAELTIRGGEITLDPAGIEVCVQRRDQKGDVDIGGDDLRLAQAVGRSADERRAPRQDRVDGGRAFRSVQRKHNPVADGRILGLSCFVQ